MTARGGGARGVLLVTREAYADLRAAPRHGAALLSQTVLGEVVRGIEARGGWRRVETGNGYLGWVRDWALAPASPRPRGAADLRRVRVVVPYLPLLAAPSRAAVRVGEAGFMARFSVAGARPAFLRARLPGGGLAWLPRSGVEPYPRAAAPAPPSRLVATGMRLLGTPYLWGGTSSRGYDCSGFVLRLYEWAGIDLPRDAWQQAALGFDLTDPRDAAPGDLLFFGPDRGRVDHVAIAIGGGLILHASRSSVRVEAIARAPGRGPASRGSAGRAAPPPLRTDLVSRFRGGKRYPPGAGFDTFRRG